MSLPGEEVGGSTERAVGMAVAVAKALMDTPDFLRLGLMLTLERRPEEPTARTRFLQVREITKVRVAEAIHELAPELSDASVRLLTTYALAGADGLFVAREIGGDDVDLVALFELHARVLVDAVARELGASVPARASAARRDAAHMKIVTSADAGVTAPREGR